MTLEDMARAIQGDLALMATKGDILALGATMDDGFKKVRNEIADVRDDVVRMNGIMVSKGDLAETLRRELDVSPYARESDIKEVRDRLLRVEQKLGLKPGHHAA
jgi:hypothetical protein